MNFTENSKPLLLLHREMTPPTIEGAFDLMLTPQFYTLKKESLLLNSRRQAQKLAPSILENLLDKEIKYTYFAYKDGEDWIFIAYDPQEIGVFLDTLHLRSQQVSKVFFAQQIVSKLDNPVALSDNESLVNLKNTATILPRSLLPKEQEYQAFDESFRIKGGIPFESSNLSIIPKKEARIVGAIALLFALMFFAEGMRYHKTGTKIENLLTQKLQQNPTLESQYARENIEQKYQKIDREERQKREVLKKLSKLILLQVQLKGLLLEQNHFVMTLESLDEKTSKRILSLAKEQQIQATQNKTEIKIEGSL